MVFRHFYEPINCNSTWLIINYIVKTISQLNLQNLENKNEAVKKISREKTSNSQKIDET